MTETIQIITSRSSCRNYSDKQITEEQLNAILEAGMSAPNGMMKQTPIFVVIQDKETIGKMTEINKANWSKEGEPYYNAPTVIAILSNPEMTHTWHGDAMCCMMNMITAANSLGLGAATVSRCPAVFDSDFGKDLKKKLGIEDAYVGIEHVVVGYPEGEKKPKVPYRPNRIYRV